jgi:nitrous oxide reductase accessory protein NosL
MKRFMGMKHIWILFLFCACLAPAVTSAGNEEVHKKEVVGTGEREECKVCGMYIDQYLRSAGELVHKDGTKEHTCGVACLLRILEDEGMEEFQSITVHDWKTGNLVDARNATYSLGSRVIPDMIPNFIAFETKEDAEAFKAEKGGEVLDFSKAMQIITPKGQTVPFRLQTAVITGKGSFGMGMGFSYLRRDRILLGADSQDPGEFIRGRSQQPRAPRDVESYGQSIFVNYGITDRLAVLANLPYFERQTSQYNQNLTTGAIRTTGADAAGLGDLDLRFRYNLWRSTIQDKWVTMMATTTLPTGKFNKVAIDSPALQPGTGAPSFGGGLLFSYNWRDLWFHSSATYIARLENGDNYKFGNEAGAGVAFHYTPGYNYMVGVEVDVAHFEKNEYQGAKVGNTGGVRTYLNFVADWRFLNALGGSFTLRGAIGLPMYEDLNYQTIGSREQVQLGGGYSANLALSYATRFPFIEE